MPTRWSSPLGEDETNSAVPDSAPEHGESTELAEFHPTEPSRKLDELVVPELVMDAVLAALYMHQHRSLIFDSWGLRTIAPERAGTAINLHGPPGTGKSLCAEGIAAELGQGLMVVDYAEIESRYVGQTPKNIRRAFEVAQKTQSVLFFDEADSILGRRLTSVTQSSDHSVNLSRSVMLKQMDSFKGMVLFASNLPGNYDSAFVRRIHSHVEFVNPDQETLVRLWARFLEVPAPFEESTNPHELAAISEGLAGGDLVNALIGAAGRSAGAEREQISSKDLALEIERVKRAKEQIGRPSGTTARLVESEEIPIEAVPE